MKTATLYQLLWGLAPEDIPLFKWRPQPWNVPSVGLPTRVATFLYRSASRNSQAFADNWEPREGPLTWEISDAGQTLAEGRRRQFGYRQSDVLTVPRYDQTKQPSVTHARNWKTPPHSAFFLPFVSGANEIHPAAYVLFCDVLLLLTAMDGGEGVLDGLATHGVGNVPFDDRWNWRSRLHLPRDAWKQIERIVRWAGRPHENPGDLKAFEKSLADVAPTTIHVDDFENERVDISLEPTQDLEVMRSVGSTTTHAVCPLPVPHVNPKVLATEIAVRIGQVSHWRPHAKWTRRFPILDRTSSREIMAQVASAFMSPSYSKDNRSPDLVLLPEVTVPTQEMGTVRDLVKNTGRASLAGVYWRALAPVYQASRGTVVTRRWFVNEAEIAIPIGFGGRGPVGIRWYRIRKPLPSDMEIGLAKALSTNSVKWEILQGRRLYRFVHPRWGDFTVAICSDLIESSFWRSLRGELLHLFMVAFNRDVDLYEALTRVRSYEEYVNLAGVNHGRYGGSLVWTPRHGHEREVARLRGGNLFVLADVELPVKELFDAQVNGVANAQEGAQRRWTHALSRATKEQFKSPPPGFVRRAEEDSK